MRFTAFKRTATATALAIAMGVGGVGQALALEFGNGDLVLALFGNTNEYLVNLGQQSSLFNGTTHVITIDSTKFSQATGTNPVSFSLYGFSYDTISGNPTAVAGGLTKPLSALTPTEQSNIFPTQLFGFAANQSGQLAGDGLSNQVIAASNPNFFTSTFGTSNTLGATFPVSTGGALGGLLNILSVNMTGSGPTLSQLGTAVLALDGSTLTINTGVAAVPLPAAVVLFGTGLIGLVGIARRSMRQGHCTA